VIRQERCLVPRQEESRSVGFLAGFPAIPLEGLEFQHHVGAEVARGPSHQHADSLVLRHRFAVFTLNGSFTAGNGLSPQG